MIDDEVFAAPGFALQKGGSLPLATLAHKTPVEGFSSRSAPSSDAAGGPLFRP